MMVMMMLVLTTLCDIGMEMDRKVGEEDRNGDPITVSKRRMN